MDSSIYNHTSSSHRDEAHSLLRGEILGNIQYSVEQIFTGLVGTSEVDSSFVDRCRAASLISCQQSVRELDRIVNCGVDASSPVNKKESMEKEMYPPLLQILQFISEFEVSASPSRRFQDFSLVPISSEPHQGWGFTDRRPDFLLLDGPAPAADEHERVFWRHAPSFLEVKLHASDSPYPRSNMSKVVNRTMAQVADYARLHLSYRPFQLYSLFLVVVGSKFCAISCDRRGPLLSPMENIWDNDGYLTECFIRVIRRFACELSEVDLGREPGVVETRKNDGSYPSFTLNTLPTNRPPGSTVRDSRASEWTTVGPPIWSSVSLLGRGTVVWKVKNRTGTLRIMKVAWRLRGRDSESSIYAHIEQLRGENRLPGGEHPDGIARFEEGADVRFMQDLSQMLSVNAIRASKGISSIVTDAQNPILHRLFLSSFGLGLWEYRTPIQFVKALKAILSGLKFLSDLNITHRDISPGNLFLSVDDTPGKEGFISDFEFADVPPLPGVMVKKQVQTMHNEVRDVHVYDDTITPPKHTGPVMTGTTQFVAVELLRAYQLNQSVPHKAYHDLESFVWVVLYSISRKVYSISRSTPFESEKRATIWRALGEMFNQPTVTSIWKTRQTLADAGEDWTQDEHLAAILAEVETPLQMMIGSLLLVVHGQMATTRDTKRRVNYASEMDQVYRPKARVLMSNDAVERVLNLVHRDLLNGMRE